jgi:DNA-binding transcriptional LysR family regulator
MADRRLRVFHAVAKHLSFTKAADALFMTQPAVTFQIKQLEEQFNTRLFDRAHGRITRARWRSNTPSACSRFPTSSRRA